ncbi:hypothetical protein BHE74_00053806, partial [Ensete ventricosum]
LQPLPSGSATSVQEAGDDGRDAAGAGCTAREDGRGFEIRAAKEFGRWSEAAAAEAELEVGVGATRSQEGHMERVVAGRCMEKSLEEVLRALSSATSFRRRRFSSISFWQQRFRYSQCTSVCFSFDLLLSMKE